MSRIAGQSKSSQKTLLAKDRQRRAVEMRMAGSDLADIADALGYSDASGAYRAISRAIDKAIKEPAEGLLAMELRRLDKLQEAHWPLALNGDPKSSDLILRMMERRSRYLGLDAPDKLDLSGTLTAQVNLVGISEDDV